METMGKLQWESLFKEVKEEVAKAIDRGNEIEPGKFPRALVIALSSARRITLNQPNPGDAVTAGLVSLEESK